MTIRTLEVDGLVFEQTTSKTVQVVFNGKAVDVFTTNGIGTFEDFEESVNGYIKEK